MVLYFKNQPSGKVIYESYCSGSEAATHRCSPEKVFWKYAANLPENTR